MSKKENNFPKMVYCKAGKQGSIELQNNTHDAGYCIVEDDEGLKAALKDGYQEGLKGLEVKATKPVATKAK